MANAIQCELRNASLVTIRWVLKKKAVLGDRITAYNFDEITTKPDDALLSVYDCHI